MWMMTRYSGTLYKDTLRSVLLSSPYSIFNYEVLNFKGLQREIPFDLWVSGA